MAQRRKRSRSEEDWPNFLYVSVYRVRRPRGSVSLVYRGTTGLPRTKRQYAIYAIRRTGRVRVV